MLQTLMIMHIGTEKAGVIPQGLQLQPQVNFSESRLISQVWERARSRVRVYQRVHAVRRMEVPVFFCLRNSSIHQILYCLTHALNYINCRVIKNYSSYEFNICGSEHHALYW